MTIEQWLSDVYQDIYVGNKIWNKDSDGGSEMIADIRGWGAIQHLFRTNEEAKQFQNEVCKFIVEAIREKIERLSQQEISEKPINLEISDKEISKQANIHGYEEHSFLTASTSNQKRLSFYAGAKWVLEQLKNK